MLLEDEINKSIQVLEKGGTLLYPTDTIWGIGCDATNETAVNKIYRIKKRDESKSLIILVSDIEMLKRVIPEIPEAALTVIKKSERPTSIIYHKPIGLAKNTIAKDTTVGIRVVQDVFCKELINRFGKPIISTSANISGEKTALQFSEISKEIINNVDYVVNYKKEETLDKASRILKFTKGSFIIIRD